MSRGFNIQNFKSAIDSNKGLLRSSHFLVDIPVPVKLRGILNQNSLSTNGNDLAFYCKAAPLPGIGVLTDDIQRYGYASSDRRPTGVVYNDAMLQFHVDANNKVRKWFRSWFKLIVNPDSRNGINTISNINGASAYEMSYKQDYAVDVRVTSFDPEGNPVISIVMVDAFPNYVGETMQDWDAKNQNMLMQVSFTYRDWYEESI